MSREECGESSKARFLAAVSPTAFGPRKPSRHTPRQPSSAVTPSAPIQHTRVSTPIAPIYRLVLAMAFSSVAGPVPGQRARGGQ